MSFQREPRGPWLPPWPPLRVTSPVDVTTAKAAGVEQRLTSVTPSAIGRRRGEGGRVAGVRREAGTFGLHTSLENVRRRQSGGGGSLHKASGDTRGVAAPGNTIITTSGGEMSRFAVSAQHL